MEERTSSDRGRDSRQDSGDEWEEIEVSSFRTSFDFEDDDNDTKPAEMLRTDWDGRKRSMTQVVNGDVHVLPRPDDVDVLCDIPASELSVRSVTRNSSTRYSSRYSSARTVEDHRRTTGGGRHTNTRNTAELSQDNRDALVASPTALLRCRGRGSSNDFEDLIAPDDNDPIFEELPPAMLYSSRCLDPPRRAGRAMAGSSGSASSADPRGSICGNPSSRPVQNPRSRQTSSQKAKNRSELEAELEEPQPQSAAASSSNPLRQQGIRTSQGASEPHAMPPTSARRSSKERRFWSSPLPIAAGPAEETAETGHQVCRPPGPNTNRPHKKCFYSAPV